jgi:hypothetical protein
MDAKIRTGESSGRHLFGEGDIGYQQIRITLALSIKAVRKLGDVIAQRPVFRGEDLPGAPLAVRALLKEFIRFDIEFGAVLRALVHVSAEVGVVLPITQPRKLGWVLAIGKLWPH